MPSQPVESNRAPRATPPHARPRVGEGKEARRCAIELWALKWQLLTAGQARFFKTSKEFKTIDRLCCGLETVRRLADRSACIFADSYGDYLFQDTVDGIQLSSVTKWFYGFHGMLSEPSDLAACRNKCFGIPELSLLDLRCWASLYQWFFAFL